MTGSRTASGPGWFWNYVLSLSQINTDAHECTFALYRTSFQSRQRLEESHNFPRIEAIEKKLISRKNCFLGVHLSWLRHKFRLPIRSTHNFKMPDQLVTFIDCRIRSGMTATRLHWSHPYLKFRVVKHYNRTLKISVQSEPSVRATSIALGMPQ